MKISERTLLILLDNLVKEPQKHTKWLNTLSYLENCGARKIARCQHPTLVKSEMLKHATEEFRHAYHLKKQICKYGITCENYGKNMILGGVQALRYLDKLEISICRFLKTDFSMHSFDLKEWAYWLVTYAIEVRAGQLYPLYQQVLNAHFSPVSVRFIIAEEEQHLLDISSQIDRLSCGAAL